MPIGALRAELGDHRVDQRLGHRRVGGVLDEVGPGARGHVGVEADDLDARLGSRLERRHLRRRVVGGVRDHLRRVVAVDQAQDDRGLVGAAGVDRGGVVDRLAQAGGHLLGALDVRLEDRQAEQLGHDGHGDVRADVDRRRRRRGGRGGGGRTRRPGPGWPAPSWSTKLLVTEQPDQPRSAATAASGRAPP